MDENGYFSAMKQKITSFERFSLALGYYMHNYCYYWNINIYNYYVNLIIFGIGLGLELVIRIVINTSRNQEIKCKCWPNHEQKTTHWDNLCYRQYPWPQGIRKGQFI